MMKRILSLGVAAALTISLSACANNDIARNDYNRNINNGGTNVRRLTDQTDINNNQNLIYRDGVYTGYGNAHANGNERATVVIKNRRIADIDLYSDRNQTRTNNNAALNRAGINDTTGNVPRNNNNLITAPGTSGNNVVGNPPNDLISNDTTGIVGRTSQTPAVDAVNDVKTRLVELMIQNQRYDVTVPNADVNLVGTINNWKLAVRRALDQARR